ncbi:PilZ domain-containing protein [Sphingomonas sp. MG17]|uniref:PilZ domain-containing protein n=1 Tax=Sphingomonas tagetis TaxID=2949092 RepID=A0A9X2HMP9_9SPHN|nr:PilZ domain-containing protein [Sphingomonas tagetis]MCP3732502.1 PilZ domain-containing protein [Sphingomonas tagetis]
MQTAPTINLRDQRYQVFLTASAERFGQDHVTRHRVRNLSSDGACIDRASECRPNETLVISIGSLVEVAAQVRWVRGGLAGLKFIQAIDIGKALGNAAIPPKAHFG